MLALIWHGNKIEIFCWYGLYYYIILPFFYFFPFKLGKAVRLQHFQCFGRLFSEVITCRHVILVLDCFPLQ